MQNPSLIKILWEEFNPKNFSSKDTVMLYLPGWSIAPASISVSNLCQKLAEKFGIRTFAIQTIPQQTVDNSLLREAIAIRDFTRNLKPSIKRVILITHSQGTIKAIHLASILWEDQKLTVSALILINPVGLYRLSKGNLKLRFLGEISKVLFQTVKEIFLRTEPKYAANLAISVIGFIGSELKSLPLFKYLKKLDRQSHELTDNPTLAFEKLKKLNVPIIFVLAQNDLVSSVAKIKEELQKQSFTKVEVIEIKDSNHGLPYTKTDALVNELIKKW